MPRHPERQPLTPAQRDAVAPHVGVAWSIAEQAVRGRGLTLAVREAAFDAATDAAMRAAALWRPGMGRTLPSLVGYCASLDVPRAMGRAGRGLRLEPVPLETMAAPVRDDADASPGDDRVRAAVGRLSPLARAVVARMHGLDGEPEAATLGDAARQLGVDYTAARKARRRAYQRLRELIPQ